MRTPRNLQATVAVEHVKIRDRRLILQAQITLELPMPQQDSELPQRLEAGIERGGQMLKRRLFQHAVEQADAALVLARRHGKQGQGIRCRGTTPFTFETVFGTVKVRRRRIAHKADGTTEVPSACAWKTPRQVALTAGLRDAACDGMLRDSAQQVVARIDARAGESGVLAKATVLEIVHDQGEQLQAAAHTRAAAVYTRDPEAVPALVPATTRDEPRHDPGESRDEDESSEATAAALVGFAGGPTGVDMAARTQPRRVDPDTVLVQLDEVTVHAQARTGCKQVQVYTGLILMAGQGWHVAAGTPGELAYQVGALSAVLEVHRGTRSLLALADGARWIREWFEGLGVGGEAMILCWYHLAKRCYQDLSRACRGREHREGVQAMASGALWQGRLEEAVAVLRARAGEMKNVEALEELINYLELRRPYLPDYGARQRAGLWIASNRVEKFNDWGVSARCKHQGMEWTEAGVVALASLEAARRNGELAAWRSKHNLPPWKIKKSRTRAA